MTREAPPFNAPIEDQIGGMSKQWATFFESMFMGDAGKDWNPTFVGLSGSLTSQKARFYRLNNYFAVFHIDLVPSGGITSTGGNTYCNNFPLQTRQNGVCWAVSGGLGTEAGHVNGVDRRIYFPAFSGITNPVSIIGFVWAA